MSQKWSFFAIGAMAGVIAVLGYALILQAKEPKACAAAAQESLDAKTGLLMVPGGSQANLQDLCWVLYRHKGPGTPSSGTGTTPGDEVIHKDEYVSLACYRVEANGRNIKLIDVRNVTWDLDLLQWTTDQKPTVPDIVKILREEAKKRKTETPK